MGLTQITTGGVDDNINIDSNTLKVDGTNNRVGIGEASPSATLHAKSGTTDVIADFESTDANAWIQIRDNSTTDTAVMVGAVGDDMRLRAGSNERVRITSAGKVGIGNTNPGDFRSGAENLVVGSGSGAEGMTIYSANNASGRICFADGTGASDEERGVIQYAHDDNHLQFNTNASERMRIDSSGRVAIGHQSPSDPLHVKGASGIQFSIDTPSGGQYTQMSFRNDGTQKAALWWNNTSSSFENYVASGAFKWNISTEKMRLDSSGRLLVGTTTVPTGLVLGNSLTAASSTGAEVVAFRSDTSVAVGDKCGAFVIGNSDTDGAEDHFVGMWGKAASTNGSMDLHFAAGRASYEGDTPDVTIKSGGDVGIGIAPAAQKLQVHESASSTESYVHITNAVSGSTSSDGLLVGLDTSANAILWNMDNTVLKFATNNTERMQIDSSGRVGIGTSSPANHLHIADEYPTIRLQSDTGSYQGRNTFGAFQNLLSIECDNDNAISSSAITFGVDGSERMRITSDGKLLIGSSTGSVHGNRLLQVGKTDRSETYVTITSSSTGYGGILFADTTTNDTGGYRGILEYQHNNDFMSFRTAAVERMRITNNGRLDVFASSSTDAHFISSGASAGTSIELLRGMHSAGSIAAGTASIRIYTNGDIQNTNNNYDQISDVKLKENIVDANSQWDDIKAIQIRNYNFKEETGHQTHTQIGVVAQEIETVSPGLVYETPDREIIQVPVLDENGEAVLDENGEAKLTTEDRDLGTVTKAVHTSVLYMKAVKALQEAQTRIETLEAKVAALEAAE